MGDDFKARSMRKYVMLSMKRGHKSDVRLRVPFRMKRFTSYIFEVSFSPGVRERAVKFWLSLFLKEKSESTRRKKKDSNHKMAFDISTGVIGFLPLVLFEQYSLSVSVFMCIILSKFYVPVLLASTNPLSRVHISLHNA